MLLCGYIPCSAAGMFALLYGKFTLEKWNVINIEYVTFFIHLGNSYWAPTNLALVLGICKLIYFPLGKHVSLQDFGLIKY